MSADSDWLTLPVKRPSETARAAATVRQRALTKPSGALGRLEALAVTLAALQGSPTPRCERVHVTVFAADHGVAAEAVSAYPQSVTVQMVRNFERGGAAINVLARTLGARLEVVDLGTVHDPGDRDTRGEWLGPGTANITSAAAMTEMQLQRALQVGRAAARRAGAAGAEVFIGGEMGIGNTTAATALACALLSLPPVELTGAGTGLDAPGVRRKIGVVQRALAHHAGHLTSPREMLRRLSGFEIAALCGSYIACAQTGLPVLVDGFIAGVAALAATQLNSGVGDWLLFAHTSVERGHARVLAALDARPLLDLGMRLGEGTGAAAAIPLLRMACALHSEMATFADAGVSER